MIQVIKENIMDASENFIVLPMNAALSMRGKMYEDIFSTYPHVQRECMKYVRHRQKNKMALMGTAQYIPSEVWALTMVDTIKNNQVPDYDSNYQYIVPVYASAENGYIGLESFRVALQNVAEKAESIHASVAIPYSSGALFQDFCEIVRSVFQDSTCDVVICKQK